MTSPVKVDLYLKNPDGTPITNICVAVKPVRAGFASNYRGIVEDVELTFTTDSNGYVQMPLWPLPYPYYLVYSDDDDSIPGQFLFYVPDVDTVVNFQDLVVTKADSNDKYADTILSQIIAAKVAAMSASDSAEASATAAGNSQTAAALSEANAKVSADSTKADRTQVGVSLESMTELSASIQDALARIQAINLQNQLLLGGYTLWVDPTGLLRIVKGTPSSTTDGTVVGTQSA